jgi:hypothetical protein
MRCDRGWEGEWSGEMGAMEGGKAWFRAEKEVVEHGIA